MKTVSQTQKHGFIVLRKLFVMKTVSQTRKLVLLFFVFENRKRFRHEFLIRLGRFGFSEWELQGVLCGEVSVVAGDQGYWSPRTWGEAVWQHCHGESSEEHWECEEVSCGAVWFGEVGIEEWRRGYLSQYGFPKGWDSIPNCKLFNASSIIVCHIHNVCNCSAISCVFILWKEQKVINLLQIIVFVSLFDWNPEPCYCIQCLFLSCQSGLCHELAAFWGRGWFWHPGPSNCRSRILGETDCWGMGTFLTEHDIRGNIAPIGCLSFSLIILAAWEKVHIIIIKKKKETNLAASERNSSLLVPAVHVGPIDCWWLCGWVLLSSPFALCFLN